MLVDLHRADRAEKTRLIEHPACACALTRESRGVKMPGPEASRDRGRETTADNGGSACKYSSDTVSKARR